MQGDYTYTTTSDAAAGAALGAFMMTYLVFVIVLYLVFSFILSRVFVKAGKPAWAAFVPIYNGWVLFEIGGKPGWWILSSLIPFVGGLIALVLYIIVSLEIAKKFGKSSTFGILGLWLFSFVGYTILAFDSSKYQGAGATVTAKASPAAKKEPEVKKDDTPTSPPLVQ
jgi:hypothetical protein